MTQEEKQLLLKDLCARLPYGVKMLYSEEFPKWFSEIYGKGTSVFIFVLSPDILAYTITELNRVKPYLRPMSSMTEEEGEEYRTECKKVLLMRYRVNSHYPVTDWLLAHHFDFRELIEKGLALEAPEEMYKTK